MVAQRQHWAARNHLLSHAHTLHPARTALRTHAATHTHAISRAPILLARPTWHCPASINKTMAGTYWPAGHMLAQVPRRSPSCVPPVATVLRAHTRTLRACRRTGKGNAVRLMQAQLRCFKVQCVWISASFKIKIAPCHRCASLHFLRSILPRRPFQKDFGVMAFLLIGWSSKIWHHAHTRRTDGLANGKTTTAKG